MSKLFSELSKSPTSIALLIGLLLILIVLIKTRKIKFTTKMMAQIGVALALATVLKVFKIYTLPQGGSVTFGSMVPILLISLFYGPEVGMLTGLLFGLITLILDPFVLHPVQVLFDYPLPFMALGIAGYFKNHKILGTLAAVALRFVFHFISGVVFFGSYAPKGMSTYLYSFIYNGSFLGLDSLICIVIMFLLPIDRLKKTIS